MPAEKFFHHHAPCKTFVYRGEIISFSVKVFLVTMTDHLIYESRKTFVKANIYSNFIGQYISVLDKNHNISSENKISRIAHVMSQHTTSLQECSHFSSHIHCLSERSPPVQSKVFYVLKLSIA